MWQWSDFLVSRNYELDREALAAVLKKDDAGYVGMIGSRRKVHRVFDALKQAVPVEKLKNVYAPIGLDIGARDISRCQCAMEQSPCSQRLPKPHTASPVAGHLTGCPVL